MAYRTIDITAGTTTAANLISPTNNNSGRIADLVTGGVRGNNIDGLTISYEDGTWPLTIGSYVPTGCTIRNGTGSSVALVINTQI